MYPSGEKKGSTRSGPFSPPTRLSFSRAPLLRAYCVYTYTAMSLSLPLLRNALLQGSASGLASLIGAAWVMRNAVCVSCKPWQVRPFHRRRFTDKRANVLVSPGTAHKCASTVWVVGSKLARAFFCFFVFASFFVHHT